jgi:hypothetical protein
MQVSICLQRGFVVVTLNILRNWIYVSISWVGMLFLAANRATIWKETSLSLLDTSNCGKSFFLQTTRPALTMTQAVQAWTPYCTTSGQWYANKILQGFFGAPIESLCEISVNDLVGSIVQTSASVLMVGSILPTREGSISACMHCSCWAVTSWHQ